MIVQYVLQEIIIYIMVVMNHSLGFDRAILVNCTNKYDITTYDCSAIIRKKTPDQKQSL